MTLLTLDEAQARLFKLVTPLATEVAPLALAVGRWLAADLVSTVYHPFADLSAMDGYAIRFDDLPGPWIVVQDIAAGALPSGPIGPGEAARILTGAPLPPGADVVLIQEEATRDGDRLRLSGEGPPARDAHVRRRGMNFAAGAVVSSAGERLTAAPIGLAASAGHGALPVRRRPRVTLMSTGDELAVPGAPIRPGQAYDANGPMLAALLRHEPVEIVGQMHLADDLPAIQAAIVAAAARSDILVTTGGASVGDHDLIRPALEAAGATVDFWRVAMRPGKPLMAGRLGDCVVLGLPGNPVSAYVTATLFLLPLIAALGGANEPLPKTLRLPIAEPLAANGPRLDFMRGRLCGGTVHPLPNQDSSALSTLATADALILRPPHTPALPAGAFADVLIMS